jgi:hypothetical protein
MAQPSSPADARRELTLLEQQIRDNRIALGLPVPEQERLEKSRAGGAAPAAPPPADDAADHAMEPPVTPSAAAPAREYSPASGLTGREPSGTGARYSKSRPAQSDEDSCAPNCRYTKAICHAADRICGLARYLGEEDALRRCERAQSDCKEARKATRGEDCDDCG